MHSQSIPESIREDEFAIDVINGEKVLITLPTILGGRGSEWEGSPIFGRHYLMALLQRGMEHDVLQPADIQRLLSRCPAQS
ncbi:hypothetical protein CXB49_01010 [Chromobacterium sp. ATCC 53434]|uniref:hypothetical protein n=1 Tax=Chromobacterium sp. (strain ATCC 53434 / SC 14030) TaxID=2059672 RepID=UPI000C76F2E0|nr:hypothetical protein [Chromobacterium sp. ATCC 53434]AUH49518.1 hypothetical protein CXB49_01010 [Chromobacterium sp. ATCC 53434]